LTTRTAFALALMMGYSVACASVLGIDDLPSLVGNKDGSVEVDGEADADLPIDGDSTLPDRVEAPCALDQPFGAGALVSGLAPFGANAWPWLTPDETTIYFSSLRGPDTQYRLYTATRANRFTSFGNITKLSVPGTSNRDLQPALTDDQLNLFFVRSSTGVKTSYEIYTASRGDASAPFEALSALGINGAAYYDAFPFLASGAQELWFATERADAGAEIYMATSGLGGFTAATPVAEVNSPGEESAPVLTFDAKTIFFGSDRPAPGAKGSQDIWMAHRDDPKGTFDAPTLVPGLSTVNEDWPSAVSRDGCRLYYTSLRDIYVAERPR
jgi:hypothetical protein